MLVNRVNTFTGVRYRDEPAILAWEIGNELRCTSCAGTTRLPDTIAGLATFLKRSRPTSWWPTAATDSTTIRPLTPGSPTITQSEATMAAASPSSHASMRSTCSVPLLSAQLRLLTARDAELWIDRHQAMAMVTGKIAYLGECGFAAPDGSERRTTTTGSAISSRCRRPARAVLAALPAGRVNNDGYAVYRAATTRPPGSSPAGARLFTEPSRVGDTAVRGQPVNSQRIRPR